MSDWFSHALDLFFRRRPPLDALMWHPETIEAGKSFTVPQGKIYEVYAYIPTAEVLVNQDAEIIAYNGGLDSVWFPTDMSVQAGWTFDKIDPATGVVTYTGGAAIMTGSAFHYSLKPQGWTLTEKQSITMLGASAFKVLWRDVTHRQ